jgi:4-amino-4-deoxy-L-arabinose transferase-like glycosyltransferase
MQQTVIPAMYAKVQNRKAAMKSYVGAGAGALLALARLLAATINLESTPPLWWDEGWTLTVARTWVERGHYGRLLDGQFAPPGLEAAFPVTAPIALSFRLLGVGVWQGRLIGVCFMLGALALMYYLARQLYNPSVAIATLAVLLLMSPIHPIVIGRQVLAEPVMLLYLLAGYVCFLLVLQRSIVFMPLAAGLWGIALITKAQVVPFWAVSLVIPLITMLFKQQWKVSGLLAIGLAGSFIASRLLLGLQQLLLRGHTLLRPPIDGLYDVTALVPEVSHRLFALKIVVAIGLPTMFGLCYAVWEFISEHKKGVLGVDLEIIRLALLALVGSWLGWYLCLANARISRYLFPPIFLGSIFVAVLICKFTDRSTLANAVKKTGNALRYLRFNRQNISTLLAVMLTALTFSVTLRVLYQSFVVNIDTSALQVAEFLNTHTADDALVETYDSELFFLLDRRYHYPPDQIHVELNHRFFLGQDVPIDYDSLAADPDYLVAGFYSKAWRLYDPVLATGAFRLLRTFSRYQVYERVRSTLTTTHSSSSGPCRHASHSRSG